MLPRNTAIQAQPQCTNMKIRTCKYCELQLVQKEHESLHAFLKRVYCNKKCAMDGSRRDKHWRDGAWPTRGRWVDG